MKQFENRVEDIQIHWKANTDFSTIMTEKLNSLGREGWELAGVNGMVFYFKREVT
ncbi:hypothetical protein [Gracilibacillus salitolerans]|uniref:hypothetical protein n=1 Tax=Gracilibacillus salitolerans TaxID=2663022 RepID=UPI001891E2C4|nr:hypothetical protein [Gracilibacillus salitolerans]